jgi:hypothetical protein
LQSVLEIPGCWSKLGFVSLSCPFFVIGLCWSIVPLLCIRLQAATMTFSAVADTSLFEANPDYDLGGTSLLSGTNQQYSRSRALFRFDLGTLPAGALVTDVQVSLVVSRRPDPDQHGGPTDSDFSLHRLFVSWGEGTGSNATGSAAQLGDATWNQRHFGVSAWASPGALIGVDYAEPPSATTAIAGLATYVWGSTAALVDDVKAWQSDPAANFGFILVSQAETSLGSGRRFGSKEQPGGTTPPAQLVVTYTVIPEPAVAGLWVVGLAVFALRRSRPV